MNGHRKRRWSVAELVPLIFLGLIGLMILLAAPTKLSLPAVIPNKTPRLSPTKPPPANKYRLAQNNEAPSESTINNHQ
jgi:hypothetical protein